MQSIQKRLETVTLDNRPVLITGETGTGKSWLARLIHETGPNSKGEFVRLYCSGHSEIELRAELFGSLSSISDQNQTKPALARAKNGTLLIKNLDFNHLSLFNDIYQFFSETGSQELLKQTRLIVTFTHKAGQILSESDIQYSVPQHKFWHMIALPPLRMRREEIPALVQRYFDSISGQYSLQVKGFSFRAMYRCISYSWPGNIRELHNAVEYASLLSDGLQIERDNLPDYMLHPDANLQSLENSESHKSFIDAERSLLHTILQITPSKTRAAELLGLTEKDLSEYISRYHLKSATGYY